MSYCSFFLSSVVAEVDCNRSSTASRIHSFLPHFSPLPIHNRSTSPSLLLANTHPDFGDAFVSKAFQRRTTGKTDPNRYIFADELITQTPDRFRIRSELLNILLAGRDTTASLLSNVWHTLSQRPDILAKLRAELDASLHGAPPDFQQLKDLKYLKAVLNESLRLYPVVPINSRQALRDTTLPLGGGSDGKSPMLVPEGTLVNWNVYAMQRRKDFYGEDAEEFRPERWLGEKGLKPGWEYLPFNGGPRICLGRKSRFFFFHLAGIVLSFLGFNGGF